MQSHKQSINKDSIEAANSNSWSHKASLWLKKKIGIRELPEGRPDGFKEITRKSLHFTSSRFSEILMEMTIMCQENSLTDFVGDLRDINVLLNSISPAVRDFLANSFKESFYTNEIKNLDWKIGE